MHASGIRLLIKKVYESSFTWKDLENYFCMNQANLKKALDSYFDPIGNGFFMVIHRIALNEKNASLCK